MTVAVVGDGAVGLSGVLAASQLGAERIGKLLRTDFAGLAVADVAELARERSEWLADGITHAAAAQYDREWAAYELRRRSLPARLGAVLRAAIWIGEWYAVLTGATWLMWGLLDSAIARTASWQFAAFALAAFMGRRAAREVKRAKSDDARPPDQVSAWSEEDVELVRALIILDSSWFLRHAANPLTDPVDEARILLRRTSTPLWNLFPGRRGFVIERIMFLMQQTSPAKTAQAESQAKSNISQHLTLVRQLDDPREVARLWQYKTEDLLELLAEEVP